MDSKHVHDRIKKVTSGEPKEVGAMCSSQKDDSVSRHVEADMFTLVVVTRKFFKTVDNQ